MAPIPVEEQFQFLLSCIRYSNSGKIDFDQVAKECKIVSKGAAAKRYERLMKAHNINLTGSNSNLSAPSPSKSPEKAGDPGSSVASPSKKKAGVKRKIAKPKGLPKKARLMKKAAVVCAEDLVNSNEESDKEINIKPERDAEDGENENENDGDNEDDDDESLFKGVVAEDDLAIDSYA